MDVTGKNGDTFTPVHSRLRAIGLLLLLAAVSACGMEVEPGSSDSSRSSVPAATASASTSGRAVSPYPTLSSANDLAGRYTDAQVQAAYRTAADHVLAVGWSPPLMRTAREDATAAAFTSVTAAMTSQCAADLNAIVTRAASGSQTDVDTIEGVALLDVRSPDTRVLAAGEAAVSDRTVTAASAALDGSDPNRVAVTLTATAEVHFVDPASGARTRSLTTRHITYDLTPGSGATSWQIDAWVGTVQSAAAKAEG